MFRYLLLCLLLAAAASRRVRQPMSTEQERRICAELCRNGLGGEPCGEVCLDLMPRGLPLQSVGNSSEARVTSKTNTRTSACPVLCANDLGYPLCQCPLPLTSSTHRHVDFHAICLHYCENEKWVLRGCPCQNAAAKQQEPLPLLKQNGALTKMALATSFQSMGSSRIDWEAWCTDMCKIGEGGSACNCDILPFSLNK